MFRVPGFGVCGLGFRVWDSGSRVEHFWYTVRVRATVGLRFQDFGNLKLMVQLYRGVGSSRSTSVDKQTTNTSNEP